MVPLLSLIMQQYNVHINVTMRRVRATIVAVEKQYALHILSLIVAFGIHNAMQMRHIIICSLSGCTIFTYIISLTARYTKRVIEHEMCVLILSTTFV